MIDSVLIYVMVVKVEILFGSLPRSLFFRIFIPFLMGQIIRGRGGRALEIVSWY
jgi:ACR3 family arsenite efflux pump ArsB